MGRLDELDLSLRLTRNEETVRLAAAQTRLVELRLFLGGMFGAEEVGPGVIVVFEGWDAGGKGGAIKRLVARLDPRHVTVSQFAAPSAREKRHHFLWRFGPDIPGLGGMCIFDRSWYGRVLVERVERLATEAQWSRSYGEIRGFEQTLVAEGLIIVKFWLHISDEEQLARFKSREKDPLKRWKLTDEDWRNRERRPAYLQAVEEMIERTSSDWAPWTLVEADSKRYARVKVVEETVAQIESGMRGLGIEPPPPLDVRRKHH